MGQVKFCNPGMEATCMSTGIGGFIVAKLGAFLSSLKCLISGWLGLGMGGVELCT